jgi:hypothetical protein
MNAASQTGRTSRARGLAWEAQLDAYHAQLRAQGRAVIVRVPTAATVIGRTTQDARGRTGFRAVWAARSGVDYIGGASCGGRLWPVAIEAKTCTTERWAFAEALGATTSPGPQWRELEAMNRLDGFPLVLLEWGAHGQWSWTFGTLRGLRSECRASVTPEDCARYAVRIQGPRWLDAMDAAADAEEVRL